MGYPRCQVPPYRHQTPGGRSDLAFESLELHADPGLSLLTYSAEPGSASEQALDELARWGATRASGFVGDSDQPLIRQPAVIDSSGAQPVIVEIDVARVQTAEPW
jgi:hypothetical protein